MRNLDRCSRTSHLPQRKFQITTFGALDVCGTHSPTPTTTFGFSHRFEHWICHWHSTPMVGPRPLLTPPSLSHPPPAVRPPSGPAACAIAAAARGLSTAPTVSPTPLRRPLALAPSLPHPGSRHQLHCAADAAPLIASRSGCAFRCQPATASIMRLGQPPPRPEGVGTKTL